MIINKENIHHSVSGDEFDTIESGVNSNKLAKLYGMLSDIYRNPIGSIVREYTSNAYDANKEAHSFSNLNYGELCSKYGWINDPSKPELNLSDSDVLILKNNLTKASSNEPIIVGIDCTTKDSYFYVQDYGIGLSPQRMTHIYFNYLDSTKEENNDEIGGFGIGAKSALSYTHTFFITTVYNNVEYQYIMSKNKVGIPIGQLLSKKENCNKDNGTLIKIPIKENDVSIFNSEIYKQLAYIDNVYQRNRNVYAHESEERVFNNAKIIQGDGWRYKNQSRPIEELHISLENITYSIDWTELKMQSINLPFALTFKTGELQPTPSRESVVYTSSGIELIKSKIFKFLNQLVEKHRDENKDIKDFKNWINNRNSINKYLKITDHINVNMDVVVNVKGIDYELDYPQYEPFKKVGIKYIPYTLFFGYDVTRYVDGYSGKSELIKSHHSVQNVLLNSSNIFINQWEKSSHIKNYYILDKINNNKDFYFLEKSKNSLQDYVDKLRLRLYDKSKWREIITCYQNEIEKIILSNTLGNYSDIVVNPHWQIDYKNGKSRYSKTATIKANGEFSALSFYNTWSRTTIRVSDIEKHEGIILIGTSSEKEMLEGISKIIKCTKSIKNNHSLVRTHSVSKSNLKILSEMTNTFTIPQLFNSEFKLISRIATAYYIKEKLEKLAFFNNFKQINTHQYDRYRFLYDYYIENSNASNTNSYLNLDDDFVIKEIIKLAEKSNILDKGVIRELEILEEYVKGGEIMTILTYDSNDTDLIVKYLKSIKKRVNSKYYLKTTHQLLVDIIQHNNENN